MARLLLVEDEQVNRNLFRRRLERKGYVVITAENGRQAIELAKTEKPDLVLMDLGLPDLDGWEVTRRIKADPSTMAIPVIALSAHATADAKERAAVAGCQAFETKPVDWASLFTKIDAALGSVQPTKPPEAVPSPASPAGGSAPITQPPASPVGEGTTVVPPSPSPAVTANDQDVCATVRKHILVVEDNDANRVMLCRRLNKHGYATTEARNGREALDLVTRTRFDLVLCDIMMPDVDGYEVLREMKADPDLQPIPVIMISAVDEMASIVRCIEMGAEDYLQKPYDPVLLQARINACLDKRRLRDQEREYLRAVSDLTRAAVLVEKGDFDPTVLARVAARDDSLGTLARVFARMACEVQARERQLRSDVQRLVAVEVDNKELIREVERITTSDAFDKARQRAENIRARRNRQSPGSMARAETMVWPTPPKQ